MINRVLHEVQSIILSNRIILDYPQLKAKDNRVNLHSFFAEDDGEHKNLGDHLSKVVVEWMLAQKQLSLDTWVDGKQDLYAIGSILLMGHQNTAVWGTGMPFEPSKIRGLFHNRYCRKLDIRAVRGPLTRQTLLKLGHECPEIYGDPAILMPLIYTPKRREKIINRLIIPHFSMENMAAADQDCGQILSMKTNDYQYVIDTICSSEVVISSSLHGIILAEAYGVPAIFFQDRPERFNYKYADWYLSTGREMCVCDGLNAAKMTQPMPLPNVAEMQEKLMDVFPYDLWRSHLT